MHMNQYKTYVGKNIYLFALTFHYSMMQSALHSWGQFPVGLTFTFNMLHFFMKTNKQKKKHRCHLQPKAGGGFVLLSRYHQVTVEQMKQLWKLYPAKETEPSWWRSQRRQRSLMETEVKQKRTDGHSLDGNHQGASKSILPSKCVFTFHQDSTGFKLDIASNTSVKKCLLISTSPGPNER